MGYQNAKVCYTVLGSLLPELNKKSKSCLSDSMP